MASPTHPRHAVTAYTITPGPPPPNVAAFINKVWSILDNRDYEKLISWSECGKNVIVHDYPNFSKEILPHYFKHNNFNSFVRQLNLYGFRKVSHPEQGVLSKVQTSEPIEFWHPNFRRGHPELLYLVQRRPVSSRISTEEKNPELSRVLTDIHHMKGKQENIGGMLETMRQDNIHLKRELELLKEKHTRQQRVLNKIIQFLVHIVYKGGLPSSNRRRPDSKYLMLTDSDGVAPPAKRTRVSLDPTPATFSFSDSSLNDLPVLPSVTVEPINSVPPPPSSSSSSLTVTSPSSDMTSLDNTNTQQILEPSLTTSPASIFPLDIAISSQPSSVSPTITSPPISATSLSLPSPPATSLPLIPLPPDSTLQYTTDDDEGFSALTSYPEWSHLTGHIDSHQLELDSLPNVLSNQLSVDPTFLNQFISLGDPPVPDYDAIDTARLLETLGGDDEGELATSREHSSQTTLIPITHSQSAFPPTSTIQSQDEQSSALKELLKDTLS